MDNLKAGEIVFFIKSDTIGLEDEILLRGLVLNLNFNNAYVIILGNEVFIGEKSWVIRSKNLFNVSTSLQMFGRVLDAIGRNKSDVSKSSFDIIECFGYVERKAYGIIDRVPVNIPLRTGLKAVDSLVPIGRGQRELIIGDRQTGKTSVSIDSILSYSVENNNFLSLSGCLNLQDLREVVWFVYSAIGQKQSTVSQVFNTLKR